MLPAKVRKAAASRAKSNGQQEPLWKGPEIDGITYSLLCRFLSCRERFRVTVIDGLRPTDSFNHRLEYGSMWHLCEESFASERRHFDGELSGVDTTLWSDNLEEYAQKLCQKYPIQQEQVEHWYNVCRTQFPVYVRYWSKQPDVKDRTPLLQETAFSVPYKLPSGRIVRLRGKWDSVDLIGKGKQAGIYLQENKTKGDIDERSLRRQLGSGFDLQTMIYLVALEGHQFPDGIGKGRPDRLNAAGIRITGIRYNVVRRPLSGGKGSIVRHKATKKEPEETKEAFYKRLSAIIEASPQEFFMRWKIEISAADVERFRRECLDPILDQLYNWWEWASNPTGAHFQFNPIHWRHPYGVWNPMDQGFESELDEYLIAGNRTGLKRATTLFPELE